MKIKINHINTSLTVNVICYSLLPNKVFSNNKKNFFTVDTKFSSSLEGYAIFPSLVGRLVGFCFESVLPDLTTLFSDIHKLSAI